MISARVPSDCFPLAVEVKATTLMLTRSFTAASSYAFVLNKRHLVAKFTYCAFKNCIELNDTKYRK